MNYRGDVYNASPLFYKGQVKMKKGLRQVFLLITVILVLSFAACGKSDAAGSKETEAQEETTTEAEVSDTAPSSPKEEAGPQEKKENKPLTTIERES